MLVLACAGCAPSGFWLVHPRGPVANASLSSWIVDTAATFLVIGPATLLVMWSVWRYRRATGKGSYKPGWSHSVPIEAMCWGFPLVVVIGLGFYTLQTALRTDPAAPAIMAKGTSADAGKPAIDIDVVSTDWQWLFIYPSRHIAAANELVLPVHTPVHFRLTSATVVTDFFIPQLAGQIDVMPGMRTWQSLIADQTGEYEGFANDFNGPGFAWMRFKTRVVSPEEFEHWEESVAQSGTHLDDATFRTFARPTINKDQTTMEFSQVQSGMFDRIVMDVMMGGTMDTSQFFTDKKSHQINGGEQPNTTPLPPT